MHDDEDEWVLPWFSAPVDLGLPKVGVDAQWWSEFADKLFMNLPFHAIKAPMLAALVALMITFEGEGFGAAPALATIDARLIGMVQANLDDPSPDSLVAVTRVWGLSCYALSCLCLNTPNKPSS